MKRTKKSRRRKRKIISKESRIGGGREIGRGRYKKIKRTQTMSGSPQIPKTAKGFYIYPKTYVIGI